MKQLRYAAVLVLSAACLLGTNSAFARTSFPTTITYDGSVDLGGGKFIDTGRVKSTRWFCSFVRTVSLIGHYPDDTKHVLDQDFTSISGAWATKADRTGVQRVTAKASREVFHVHHHRKVCEAASVSVFSAT